MLLLEVVLPKASQVVLDWTVEQALATTLRRCRTEEGCRRLGDSCMSSHRLWPCLSDPDCNFVFIMSDWTMCYKVRGFRKLGLVVCCKSSPARPDTIPTRADKEDSCVER